MLHQIDFAKARASIILVSEGADRNLLLEQGAGFRSPMRLGRPRTEDPPNAVHTGRTDALQMLEAFTAKAKVALVPQMDQFGIQGAAQAFGIDLVKELGRPQDGTLVFIGIKTGMGAANAFGRVTQAALATQQGNRMFAMITGCGDKLIQDLPAFFLGDLGIPLSQSVEILSRRFRMTHKEDS
jgi:hypothetical protein